MGINRGKAETILPELSVDVGDAGLIYVDSSNRTGFGVSDPDTKVEIFHAGNQLKLSYDSDSFATFGVADASHLTIATGENGNLILDAAGDIELNADGADIVFKDATHQLAKFTAGSATLVMGSGVAEDTMVLFDGNAQDFRIGLDDGTDTLEIGHGSSHGTNTALSVNSSGQITTFNIPAAAVAQASDHIIFLDGGATGAPKAESIDDFLTAIAGSGISVSSSQLTAAGVSALNDLSDVSFSSGDLTITSLDLLTTSASAHDAAGTAVVIRGGNTTAGTTNDIAGGNLTLAGGQGKGGGAGGNIVFQVANAGGAGSSINSLATALTISDDKSAEFESTIQSRTSVTVLNTTTSSATQGGALILQADDGAAMAQDHRLGLIQFEGAEDASNSLTVGARIEALCDAGWSATENGTRMVFSTTDGNANVSEVLKLDSNKLATFAGAVTVTGDTTVANNLLCGQNIAHATDTDTRIVFANVGVKILFEAGGVEMLRLVNDSQDEIVFNDPSADVDFRIESDDETHMFFVDANNNRISIGDSVDDPAATLEITNHASAGAFGAPLLQLNSNDTDQIGIDINAANVDADVIDITADAVTTAHIIDVSADALTTGSILNLVSASTTTGDRALVSITNDHASAVNTQALLIKNDAIAAKSTVVFESTVAETNPLLELINSHDSADKPPMLRFNKLGNIADDVDIGHISFYAENSAGTPEAIEYAKILIEASDTSDANEAGQMTFYVQSGGKLGTASLQEALRIGQEDTDGGTGGFALIVNNNNTDLHFQVKSKNENNAIFMNATDDRVGFFKGAPTSRVHFKGSIAQDQTTQASGSLTLTEAHGVLVANTSGGNVTFTLPAISGIAGREYTFLKIHASNQMIIDPNGSENIYRAASPTGGATISFTDIGSTVTLICTSIGWVVQSEYIPT